MEYWKKKVDELQITMEEMGEETLIYRFREIRKEFDKKILFQMTQDR